MTMDITAEVTHDNFLSRLRDQPLATVAAHYAGCLAGHEKAMRFTQDTLRLSADELAAQQVGFADRSLGTLIPPKTIKLGRAVREALTALGLYKHNGRETLRGRVTVPIRDQAGVVIGIRGHQVDRHASGPAVIVVGAELAATETKITHEAPTSDSSPASQPEPTPTDELILQDNQLLFQCDDRHWRIRGLEQNASTCTLKVALMVSRESLVHVDSLDLVKAASRKAFIKAAASELFVDEALIKRDVGRLLLKLETLQAEQLSELKRPQPVELTPAEQAAALELLRDPRLLDRIVADLDACGIVGERTGKLAGYLAAVSRKLDKPLAIVIQSSSSAGKTSLMDAILAMVPEEDQLRLSGMSGQSLFYFGRDELRHKILAISEDEGIAAASYALKLLQSEGRLTHAVVGRGADGRAATERYTVEGPVALFLTTTAMEIDEELVNRCLVLSVDESRFQTDAIHRRQRAARTFDGYQSSESVRRRRQLHCHAQRLLQPLQVINPYAPQLTFASDRTRLRRDHEKYLTLIDGIALLHQHQRPIHETTIQGQTIHYVEAVRSDIAVANAIAGEVLGRSLDELSPQTRHLLVKLNEFVEAGSQGAEIPRSAFRFTRRDLRQAIGWSDFQVRSHLSKLVDLEYVVVHRGTFGGRYLYELLYAGEGQDGRPFLVGLADPAKLSEPAARLTPPLTNAAMRPTSSIEDETLRVG